MEARSAPHRLTPPSACVCVCVCLSKADVIKVTEMNLIIKLFLLAVLGFFFKGTGEVIYSSHGNVKCMEFEKFRYKKGHPFLRT